MPSQTYNETPITEWNTNHFRNYLIDEHKRLYNVSYAPFRGFNVEAGMLGRFVGTARKKGLYDRITVKQFIDECFAEYKPSPQYPGLSFGFMVTYMMRVMQRIQANQARKANAVDAVNASDNDSLDELEAWL